MAAVGLPEVGQRAGEWLLEEKVGEGGMGVVFRGRDATGSPAAVKVVHPSFAADPGYVKRFRREAVAARAVSHDHVVAVLGDGDIEGLPFLALEFLSGGSLADRIAASGPLEVSAALEVCAEVASGLGALHEAGIVHRDVKPENVLFDEQGRAHVTDFGLAKQSDASMLTRQGQTLGSVDYISPEQIRGEAVGPPADVYSLGCVVYEALTGTLPFAGREGMAVLWAHLQDKPPDPREARPGLDQQLCETIMLALAKEADSRPQTPVAYVRMLRLAAG